MNNRQIILLKNVKVNNIKNITLSLPINSFIVFTGISGSGKSSIAFDTIFMEGQKRFIESLPYSIKKNIKNFTTNTINSDCIIEGLSPTIAISQQSLHPSSRSTVGTITGIYGYLKVLFSKIAIPHCPISNEKLTFQSIEKIIDQVLSLSKEKKVIFLAPYTKNKKGSFKDDLLHLQKKGFLKFRIDGDFTDYSNIEDLPHLDPNKTHTIEIVIDRLSLSSSEERIIEAIKTSLKEGFGSFILLDISSKRDFFFSQYGYSPKSNQFYGPLDSNSFSFNHPSGMCNKCKGIGDLFVEEETSKDSDDNNYSDNFEETPDTISLNKKKSICPACNGRRLAPYPAAATISEKKIWELSNMSISSLFSFFEKFTPSLLEKPIVLDIIFEIQKRLKILIDLNLSYLSLDRPSFTLSGGEAQRTKLATQIGSEISGITYILDEPSIGLHHSDHKKLLKAFFKLRDFGNTVIVVEHDRQTILAADHVVEFGPGGGSEGGNVIFSGTVQNLLKCKNSVTAPYLTDKRAFPSTKKRINSSAELHLNEKKLNMQFLKIKNAKVHNLKNLDVSFPLESLVCITGVSGSGKSSLICDTLYPQLKNIISRKELPLDKTFCDSIEGCSYIKNVFLVDQSPLGKSKRSNTLTYLNLFDTIRELFANLPESREKKLTKEHFSFNLSEGGCDYCQGSGRIKLDTMGLEDHFITCSHCEGNRFSKEVLSIKLKGKNIANILDMEVKEAISFFYPFSKIRKKLQFLEDVGLNYLHLGQNSKVLSGGELQRIKLAKELSKRHSHKTLYILDEPTTGLHFEDIKKQLKIFQKLVDMGNSIFVIEHNIDFIKHCDWIIDMGPSSGENGGEIIAEGTVNEFISSKKTKTAIALKENEQLSISPTKFNDENSNNTRAPTKKSRSLEITASSRGDSKKFVENNSKKEILLKIPHGKTTIFCGPSNSVKGSLTLQSLAFDVIYAESQLRYIESFPPYIRQLIIKNIKKIPAEIKIQNLPPAITIRQQKPSFNPRSTIGTFTEIYDHLCILFAHLGEAYSPETLEKLETITPEFIFNKISSLYENSREKISILAPFDISNFKNFEDFREKLLKKGFLKIRINGEYFELDSKIPNEKFKDEEIFIVVERLLTPSQKNKDRILESIKTAASLSKILQPTMQSSRTEGSLTIEIEPLKKNLFFNLSFAEPSTGKFYKKITPHGLSFNSEEGMCLRCHGLGIIHDDVIKEDPPSNEKITSHKAKICPECNGARLNPIARNVRISDLRGLRPIRWARGLREQNNGITLPEFCNLSLEQNFHFLSSLEDMAKEKNINDILLEGMKNLSLMIDLGLGYLSLGRSIASLSCGELLRIKLSKQIGLSLNSCLYILEEPAIGLHPREIQNLSKTFKKLTSIGNTVILVSNNENLMKEADFLVEFGNSCAIRKSLDNDLCNINAIDAAISPINMVNILSSGTFEEVKKDKNSEIGKYFREKKDLLLKTNEVKSLSTDAQALKLVESKNLKFLKLENFNIHNLKKLNISFPIGKISCITGVSGSGKSTLLLDILKSFMEEGLLQRKISNDFSSKTPDKIISNYGTLFGIGNFDRLVVLEQTSIFRTETAEVASYIEILPIIREIFALLPFSKANLLKSKNFNSTHPDGMCENCNGFGYKKFDLQYLPSVDILCEYCNGAKLNQLSLRARYKQKNIREIFDLSLEEGSVFFSSFPKIEKKLTLLLKAGLGYLKLGQMISELSHGEIFRINLCLEIAKSYNHKMARRTNLRNTNNNAGTDYKTLYLIEEPSVGLNFEEVEKLISLLLGLKENGDTVIIIENNEEVLKNGDFLIDIGELNNEILEPVKK